METAAAASLPLPEAFIEFLNQNGLDPSIYNSTIAQSTPRYIRLKPGYSDSETFVSEIEIELNCKLDKVEWLPGFYSIPPHIQIASTESYKQGKMYGMDAASGAAVFALNVSSGDHVLDLCAAPGAKLCMLLDLLGSSGSLTGVDIAKHRLAACRTMLQKYALGDRCRLFVANGTSFSLLPLQNCTDAFLIEETKETFKEWTPKRPWKERKASKARDGITSKLVAGTQEPELIFYGRHSGVVGLTKSELFRISCSSDSLDTGYDKVLVDAECTHDGSIKHIQKFEDWGWDTLERRILDAQRTDILTNLQFNCCSK
ncbi:hypothetical protein AQUCO_05800153v1 [Aquilegia coerulea]|uniref:SAM-dependent MTase RsmB/NOP-type domain-containing protein n=1 Tax=Aquilegia coerulea TaxID=218851 RepID=A0A2G5CF21_AQUCA|nr:hypothetical protein AQUCO_05800153v1 [Aquilegia coerulea]